MPGCRDWRLPETPTRVQLNAVASARSRFYAAGNRGVVLERQESGWEVVVKNGVSGRGRGLLDIAATDDGTRL